MRFNLRALKLKYFLYLIVILTLYTILANISLKKFIRQPIRRVVGKPIFPYVVVHLDLKGAPPKVNYLVDFFAMIKKRGANAILLEYEDMFPYIGKLAKLSSKHCYSRNLLKKLLVSALSNDLEVIPLVQTFGHMEHALKLPEFQHLREDFLYQDTICPSNVDSQILIKRMLQQVMKLHMSIAPLKYIHIGADELYHINKCQRCKARNVTNLNLYIWHVNEVAKYVNTISKDTRVLIWDDMLRSVTPNNFRNIDKNALHNIEPVYWDYTREVKVSHISLMTYHQYFKSIWVAAAFKGADGPTTTLPKFRDRISNLYSWMTVTFDNKFGGDAEHFVFQGIILTGWSRYSHFEPLCELLPVSIPSLISDLLIIEAFKGPLIELQLPYFDVDDFFYTHIEEDLNEILDCDGFRLNLDNVIGGLCKYNGHEVFDILYTFVRVTTGAIKKFNALSSPLSSVEYYSKTGNFHLRHIMENIKACKNTLGNLSALELHIKKAMSNYYYEYVIKEYIQSKTFKLKKDINYILNISNKYYDNQSNLKKTLKTNDSFNKVNVLTTATNGLRKNKKV